MGIYKHLKELWKQPKNLDLWQERLIEWRRAPAVSRIERPTRLDRARSLGYKAKQGIIVVRSRVLRGGHKRPRPTKGRRSKRMTIRKNLRLNYQQIAEMRAASKYKNCEVRGSYEVAKDGKYYWFEIIMIDREHPQMLRNEQYEGNAFQRGRVFRGKTSAGRKARGLRGHKGKGAEKLRPSRRARQSRKTKGLNKKLV